MISNRKKRRIGVRYAKKHKLDYKEVYNYLRNWCDVDTEEEVIQALDQMRSINLLKND